MTTLYAIKNKVNGRFITGTDFNYTPPRQLMGVYERPLLLTQYELKDELKRRHINLRRYKVCTVEVKEVNENA
jgi:hypothetical protein